MFGYLFYWFFQRFKRVNHDDNPIFAASVGLGSIQFLLFYNVLMIYGMLFSTGGPIKKGNTMLITIVLAALFTGFNYFFYGKKTDALAKKHESRPINKWLKGWVMWLFSFGLFLFPIFSSFVLHLFKLLP